MKNGKPNLIINKKRYYCDNCQYNVLEEDLFVIHVEKCLKISFFDYLSTSQHYKHYCIFCRKEQPYFKHKYYKNIKKCNCIRKNYYNSLSKEEKDSKYTKFTNTRLKNKKIKDSKGINNYHHAALKREQKFRDTINEFGENKKEVIAKKAGPKISKSLKSKILNSNYVPKSSNRFKHQKLFFLGKTFRSSWEFLFYILNKDSLDLEFETKKIKYFDIEKNKERIYILDFYDKKTETYFEIKPIDLLNSLNFYSKKEGVYKAIDSTNKNFLVISEFYFFSNFKNLSTYKGVYGKNIDRAILNLESQFKSLKSSIYLSRMLERYKNLISERYKLLTD